MMGAAALLCVASLLPAVDGIALSDQGIRTAVNYWLSDSATAEAAYGHISTWDTSGVTDMSYLFCGTYGGSYLHSLGCSPAAESFNDDIGAWDVSGVTRMDSMFMYALAFDQDLGWLVDDDVSMYDAFYFSGCSSTSCGVVQSAIRDYPMTDSTIRTAVEEWLSDRAAAEATYGHISTWDTSGVTKMNQLFRQTSFARKMGRVSGTRGIPDMARLRRGDERIPRPRGRLTSLNPRTKRPIRSL